MLFALFGMAVMGWGAFGLSSWKQGEIEALSAHIAAGDRVNSDRLRRIEPSLSEIEGSAFPNPRILHDVAMIRLRQAELEIEAGHLISGNPVIARAEAAARASLSLTPGDGFLWFALSWLSKLSSGFDDELVPFLNLSYETAGHEGWVAVHRNAMMVPLLSGIPLGLRDKVLQEFANLVSSGYFQNTVEIFKNAGSEERRHLLNSLVGLPQEPRRLFARALEAGSGGTLSVPGFAPSTQPWRR